MGACFQHGPTTKIKRSEKHKNNPIKQILSEYSVDKFQEKWERQELSTIEDKIKPNEVIDFQKFLKLFPKLKDFSPKTQKNIYYLFAFEGYKNLSKKQLKGALTLIRKVNDQKHLGEMMFYVYSNDINNTSYILESQFELFKAENKKYKYDEQDSEIQELYSTPRKGSKKASQIETRKKVSEKKLRQSSKQNLQQKIISKAQFIKNFQQYGVKMYQKLFQWDMSEQQEALVNKLTTYKRKIGKNSKVFLISYPWILEWKSYVDQKFNTNLEFNFIEEPQYGNNGSFRLRRKSTSNYASIGYPKKNSKKSPGQIKNQVLLKKTEDKTQTYLEYGLRQFTHYICIPPFMWHQLVNIYKGGPELERTYPNIYYNTVIKVQTRGQISFIPKKIQKLTTIENIPLEIMFSDLKKEQLICLYKYPGRLENWQIIQTGKNAQNQKKMSFDLFNKPKTYVTTVGKYMLKKFLSIYNIKEEGGKQIMLERILNYGSEINILINGVLTKALVVEIESEEKIMVEYFNQKNEQIKKIIDVDSQIRSLNPSDLNLQKKINDFSGMDNLGNTCYINSVLQCLIRTPFFGGYLQNINFKDQKSEEELLLEQIYKIYSKATKSQDTIKTKHFKRVLDVHCPYFQGNNQHDSQELLLSVLGRICEQIKNKKKEYLNEDSPNKMEGSMKNLNKKVTKFFSGKTEALTKCKKCGNQNKRVEPFFTYSLSLPILKESQFYYIYVGKIGNNMKKPTRYGITMHSKSTIQQFMTKLCQRHKILQKNALFYTVFNNQLLNKLQKNSFNRQVQNHLNFDTKIVCQEVENKDSPKYRDFSYRQFEGKSIKIELRQRVYSEKSKEYKSIFLPIMIEINEKETWTSVQKKIHDIVQIFLGKSLSQITPTGSYMRNTNTNSNNIHKTKQESDTRCNKNQKEYEIHTVREGMRFESECFFCHESFTAEAPLRETKNRKYCKGKLSETACNFDERYQLFTIQRFKNYWQDIIFCVDWNVSPLLEVDTDVSYDLSIEKAKNRKDFLKDVLVNNFTREQQLELRCQQPNCKHEIALRKQKIVQAPNILLLHLKRFNYQDNIFVKLNNNVVYPQTLTLPQTNENYELYGVIVHEGSGTGGHYYSYVKVNNLWYKCNDTIVSRVKQEEWFNENAYILFYRKKDFEPSLIYLSF